MHGVGVNVRHLREVVDDGRSDWEFATFSTVGRSANTAPFDACIFGTAIAVWRVCYALGRVVFLATCFRGPKPTKQKTGCYELPSFGLYEHERLWADRINPVCIQIELGVGRYGWLFAQLRLRCRSVRTVVVWGLWQYWSCGNAGSVVIILGLGYDV